MRDKNFNPTLTMSHDGKHWELRYQPTYQPGDDLPLLVFQARHNAVESQTRLIAWDHGSDFVVVSDDEFERRVLEVMTHEELDEEDAIVALSEKATTPIVADKTAKIRWGLSFDKYRDALERRWYAIIELIDLSYTL